MWKEGVGVDCPRLEYLGKIFQKHSCYGRRSAIFQGGVHYQVIYGRLSMGILEFWGVGVHHPVDSLEFWGVGVYHWAMICNLDPS